MGTKRTSATIRGVMRTRPAATTGSFTAWPLSDSAVWSVIVPLRQARHVVERNRIRRRVREALRRLSPVRGGVVLVRRRPEPEAALAGELLELLAQSGILNR